MKINMGGFCSWTRMPLQRNPPCAPQTSGAVFMRDPAGAPRAVTGVGHEQVGHVTGDLHGLRFCHSAQA